MNIVTGLVVYVVVWWLIFFMVLPYGVTSQADRDQVERGTEPGAPARPMLLRKVLITTAIALVAWVLVFVVIESGLISMNADIGPGRIPGNESM